MRTQLDRLTDQQRSIQAELEQAERELAQKREEAKSRKKLSGIAPQEKYFRTSDTDEPYPPENRSC